MTVRACLGPQPRAAVRRGHLSGLVAAVVLVTAGWQVISRHRLMRRVQVQSGLLTQSWLKLDSPPRWIPVHFDPALVTLPAPTSVQLHGDPQRRALVAAEVDGTWLHPCGAVRVNEPRGRRIDSPASPDPLRSTITYRWRRQLQTDARLLTVARS